MAGKQGRSVRRRSLVAGLAAGSLCLLSACAGNTGEAKVGAQPSVPPSIYPLPPPAVEAAAGGGTESTPDAVFGHTPDGVVLPDAKVTPGAVFPDVTAANICESFTYTGADGSLKVVDTYSQGVRQPRFNDKVSAFTSYGISIRDRDIYQVDHLVPVSLGGDNSEENLWPQPYDEIAGADQKDLVERQLRGLVCSDKLALGDAQSAIATNWWLAYDTYMGLPIDPGTEGPEPWKRPMDTPGEVTNGGLCTVEGEVGYTDPKRIRLTCTATSSGELRWAKRY